MPFQAMRLRQTSAGGLSYDATVLADSPAGYWKLDETSGAVAADSSGNGRDGVIVGSPTMDGTGFTFNGTDQCITFPSTVFDVIGDPSQSYTLELFVTAVSGISSPVALFDKSNISSPAKWNLLQYVAGSAHFQLYNGVKNPIIAAGSLPTGTQILVHAVRDIGANQIRTYLNGAPVGSASAELVDSSNSVDLCIGARQAGTDRFAKIKVRRAAVYLGALSSTRIDAHYAARNL